MTTTEPTYDAQPIEAPEPALPAVRAAAVPAAPAPPPVVGADRLLELAISQNVGIDTLERLMAMRDKMLAEQAERAFLEAMAGFQGDMPIIHKNRDVRGKFSFTYATLDEIVRQVQPCLKKWGLSYTVDTEFGEGWLASLLTIYHTGGHKKTFRFQVPIDRAAAMNDTQKFGSARTYSQRYAFCGGFGILTSDQDDDAQAAPASPAAPGQAAAPSAPAGPIQMPQRREGAAPPAAPGQLTAEELREIERREASESGAAPDFIQPGWKQVKAEKCEIKEGKSANGRAWTRYGFYFAGAWHGTFSETVALAINDAIKADRAVWVRVEKDAKGHKNIMEVFE